jgi:hypothetical protein
MPAYNGFELKSTATQAIFRCFEAEEELEGLLVAAAFDAAPDEVELVDAEPHPAAASAVSSAKTIHTRQDLLLNFIRSSFASISL